jgi:Ca2+-binding EF-hand superfamily protein
MNGISSLSSMSQLQSYQGQRKPDPEEMAQQLFAKLDASSQGYIEKSDLQSAFTQVSSVTDSSELSTDDSDLDELFNQLDSDGDGKVTESEFTNSLLEIDEQINDLFSQMRMDQAMANMPPPPPPPEEMNGADDTGFTKEELEQQLEEIGTSDEKRSTLIENIVANFDEADSDGDGKVSMNEAMAFDQSSSSATAATDESSDLTAEISEKVMLQIMRLMESYISGTDTETDATSTLSVSV